MLTLKMKAEPVAGQSVAALQEASGLFLARVFSILDLFSEAEILDGNLILSPKTTAGAGARPWAQQPATPPQASPSSSLSLFGCFPFLPGVGD